MDAIGAYIARLHTLLGHDKAAAVIGADPGNKDDCLLCAWDRDPSPERKAAVEDALTDATYPPLKAAALAYRAHTEGCWYSGVPIEGEFCPCQEHARLYAAWQKALREFNASRIREEGS